MIQTLSPKRDATRLSEITGLQWRSGLAAWLGWFFDGVEMHLYTLVAAPIVMQLLHAASPTDPAVKTTSSIIQAAFLIGWALGGGFFGWVGDRIGRARCLALTVLAYSIFTGLSFFADTWWQLMLCRFVAALGIGGEWAVGSALLAETWPKAWRPWIAAVLQCGVSLGTVLATLVVGGIATMAPWLTEHLGHLMPEGWEIYPRCVFLLGVIPALLVSWMRRHVPEPEEWTAAQEHKTASDPQGISGLFHGPLKWTSLKAIGVCATSLTGWWAFMFWHAQHIRALPEVAAWDQIHRDSVASGLFAMIIGASLFGNLVAGWLAKAAGYRKAIFAMLIGLGISVAVAHLLNTQDYRVLRPWYVAAGFFSGAFGLFTMYLPPLFPTLLRTTGAGFCYNIGRIFAALGTVYFGLYSNVGDFRVTLLSASALFLPAAVLILLMPEPPVEPVQHPTQP